MFHLGQSEILWLLFVVLSTFFWIWLLVLAVMDSRLTPKTRIIWVLAIVLTHFLGALTYLVVRLVRDKESDVTAAN